MPTQANNHCMEVKETRFEQNHRNRSATATDKVECKNNSNDILAPHIHQQPSAPHSIYASITNGPLPSTTDHTCTTSVISRGKSLTTNQWRCQILILRRDCELETLAASQIEKRRVKRNNI
ncbi:hypothetical protein L484_015701 [Morus notabilis]|uniref:Uncharacterized protein n=1 Tax=Morus notabilis TaxID=981085 RepID=W9S0E0_9ROSA|nr:hypothetical protein L484_015701 [Morus notabilis]